MLKLISSGINARFCCKHKIAPATWAQQNDIPIGFNIEATHVRLEHRSPHIPPLGGAYSRRCIQRYASSTTDVVKTQTLNLYYANS